MPFLVIPRSLLRGGFIAKRISKLFQLQKYLIFPPSKYVCSHPPTGMINGVPEPARLRFLPHVTPHLIELRRQPATLGELGSAADLDLHLCGAQRLENRLVHLLEVRFLFFSSLMTVWVL